MSGHQRVIPDCAGWIEHLMFAYVKQSYSFILHFWTTLQNHHAVKNQKISQNFHQIVLLSSALNQRLFRATYLVQSGQCLHICLLSYDVWVHVDNNLPLKSGKPFVTACVLAWATWPFYNGVYSYRKDFTLMGADFPFKSRPPFKWEAKVKLLNLFPLQVHPFTLVNANSS